MNNLVNRQSDETLVYENLSSLHQSSHNGDVSRPEDVKKTQPFNQLVAEWRPCPRRKDGLCSTAAAAGAGGRLDGN